jgi:hypothetical protein
MQGVEVHDKDSQGCLAFDLREILLCLGDDATDRVWHCENLWVTGEAFQEFEFVEKAATEIEGSRLLSLAERTAQVIDGDFLGRRRGEKGVSIRIRAVDSSFWEVIGDEACLDKLRAGFRDVRPAPRREPG